MEEIDPALVDAIATRLSVSYSDMSGPSTRISPKLIAEVLEAESSLRDLRLEDIFDEDEMREYQEIARSVNKEFSERIYKMLTDEEIAIPPSPELIERILRCGDRAADEYLHDYFLSLPCDMSVDRKSRAENLQRRGFAKRVDGEFEAALKDYSKACRLTPLFPEPFIERAEIYMELGQEQNAQKDAIHMFEIMLETRNIRCAADVAELLANSDPEISLRSIRVFITELERVAGEFRKHRCAQVGGKFFDYHKVEADLTRCEQVARYLGKGDSEIHKTAQELIDDLALLRTTLDIPG